MDREALITEIIQEEQDQFDRVENEGGRASCQDDSYTFDIMRRAQFGAWDDRTLYSYRDDLRDAKREGRNMLTEKYAYMMEQTAPQEYEALRPHIPETSEAKWVLIRQLMRIHMEQTERFMERHPVFRSMTRPVHSDGDTYFTSIETYERGELRTYSERTLTFYLEHLTSMEHEGIFIVDRIFENTVRAYGYDSVAAYESSIS